MKTRGNKWPEPTEWCLNKRGAVFGLLPVVGLGLDIMGRKLWSTIVIVVLVTGSALHGRGSRVQSSEVSAFAGTWVITMTNPPGAQETVRIFEKDGIIAASVQLGKFPPSDVTGILKDGEMLVLTTRRFENGQPIWVVMSLTLDGGTMNVAQMLERSQTIKRGSGERQEG